MTQPPPPGNSWQPQEPDDSADEATRRRSDLPTPPWTPPGEPSQQPPAQTWGQPAEPPPAQPWGQPAEQPPAQPWARPAEQPPAQTWAQPAEQQQWQPPAAPPGGEWGQQQPAQQPWGQHAQPDQQQWGQQPAAGYQPTTPEQGWQQPAAGQPWQQQGPAGGNWDYLGGPVEPPAASKRRRGPVIIAAVAAVAVVAGGVATYVAVSDKGSSASGGANTPQAAVQSVITALNKSDLLGVLNDLPPAEQTALVDPIKDLLATEKKLNVVKPDTNLSDIAGTKFDAQNIAYSNPVTINDHVQVVSLTAGTVTVSSNISQIPFTDAFLKAAFPDGLPTSAAQTNTLDLSKVADRNNGNPVRIATQKVGDKWYPSLMYTVADNAAHSAGLAPQAADYIAPAGASSAENAVRQVIDAAGSGDYRALIAVTSPDEMAALHDYGGLVLKQAPQPHDKSFTVKDLQLSTKSISDGGTRASLKSITVTSGGDDVTVSIDGTCLKFGTQGASQTVCASLGIDQISKVLDKPLSADQRAALEHLFAGLPNVGIDLSQSGGKWYVNPARSYLDVTNSLLSGLQGNDLITLIGLIRQH